jgi:signal peptidase II
MRRTSLLYYFLIAIVIIFLDQVTKLLIINHLAEGGSVSVIGDLLYFRFIYNQGGALGTMLGPSWVYTILTIIALILIIRYFFISQSEKILTKVALALILGGAIGNLIDRLRIGKVVDFIDVDFPDIPFLHIYRWFTFNIADAGITIGLVLFAISILVIKKIPDHNGEHLPEISTPEVQGDSR